jgi:threonine/homoserine/homoserine lactone efflux protein
LEIFVIGIIAIFHYLLSVQIDYMKTISVLGFKSELYVQYLQTPWIYHWTNRVLGIVLILSGLMNGANVVYTILIWFVIYLASGKNGRIKAYARYREIMIELQDLAENDEERQDYRRYSEFSDKEIEEIADRNIKYHS